MKFLLLLITSFTLITSMQAQTYQLWFRIDQVWSSADNDFFSADDISLRFDVFNAGWKGEHCLTTSMNATATNTVNWYYPANGWTTTNTSFQYGFQGWEDDGGSSCTYDSGDDYQCTDWNIFSTNNFTTYSQCTWNNIGWASGYGTNGCGGTFDVNVSFYYKELPSLGTYSYTYPTLYTCGDTYLRRPSDGAIVTNSVSTSGAFGTIGWQWGTPAGGWNDWGATGGNCCFNNGSADKMRVFTQNCAGDRAYGSNVNVVLDGMNNPTSASSSETNICSGATGNITLSYSGGSTGVLGRARWYSGTCGGTYIGEGNNLVVTKPSVSTTYFVRFENPCSNTSCTWVNVNVSDVQLLANAISPTCVGGSNGSIDLSISGAINGARVLKIVQLDNEPFNTNEIQAFNLNNTNVALASSGASPSQSSTCCSGAYPVSWLNDGNTNNGIGAHTNTSVGQWQKVTWPEPTTLDRIVIWNRSDCCQNRMDNIRVEIYGDDTESNLLYSSVVNANTTCGSCNAGPTSFTLQLDGGDFNPINTYAWSNSATTEDITNLSADSYDVTVTDAYGCVSSLTGITVSEPANHNLTAVVTNEVCPSDNNGSLDLTINSPRISAEPSAFSDLALWTKGDAGVVKNKDGDVIQWQDISGNDNHFYTNFGSNVQEVSSSIGAKPAIRFNANEIMETQTSFNSNPYTMIVVGKLNGTNQRLISSGSKNWLFGWWGGSKDRMFAEGWVHQGSSAGITNNYIYSVTGSGTGIVGSGTSFWSNGTQLTTLGTDGRQAPGIISLGGWGTGNSERSSGDVSEVIYYNKALSSNERMALEKYLADKYGISISHSGVDPTVSWSNSATTEDISSLDAGTYTVSVSDVAGCSTNSTFVIDTDNTLSVAPTSASTNVNIFCAGEPVTLTVVGGSLGTNANWVWYDDAALTSVVASGTATSTTILPSSTTKYYVRAVGDCNTTAADSTDLVVANAFSTTPNSQVALANSTSSSSCGVNGVNWHYFYNESGELLASINPNGQNLGYTTVTITVGDNGPFGQGLAPGVCGYNGANGGEYAMPRYWDITVENQPIIPGNSVDVRFYYTNADVVSLVSITGAQNQNYKDCWGEVTGESDLMMTIDHGSSSEPISISPTAASFGGSLRQIEFPMTEFSGGKLHSNGGLNPGNALPVELISFKAETVNEEAIKLDWTTATEINNEGFEVQRSTNGMSFEKIAWVAGNGNTNKNIDYALVDKDVETGILYYYRLKQIDFDGAFEYSKVVSASLTNLDLIEVSYFIPNPSSNATKLVFEGNRNVLVQIEIMDNIGRKVSSKVQTIESGKNTITFDLSEFSNGVYTARIIMDKEEFTRKLVVRK